MYSQPQVGQAIGDLDTPSMLVDLTLMKANIARLMERLRGTGVNVRPHAKTIKCPELALKLLAAGASGICVAKISEAEVMCAAGVEDVLITTEICGQPKVSRLIQLLRQHRGLKSVVDSKFGAEELNRAIIAEGNGMQLQILIDINVGQNRTGVEPGDPALKLARQIGDMPGLRLIGVQGYEGHLQHVSNQTERETLCRAAMQKLTGTAQLLREIGCDIKVVTTGGTGTAEICATVAGVTETQPGSFIFMDTDYRDAIGSNYANALTVISTVLSRPHPRRAVIDAGMKSLSTDSGNAEPKGLAGVRYQPMGDEHGILEWDDDNVDLPAGARIELLPSHIDTTVNLHDFYYGCRNGKVEEIWPVSARGKVQ